MCNYFTFAQGLPGERGTNGIPGARGATGEQGGPGEAGARGPTGTRVSRPLGLLRLAACNSKCQQL